MNKARSDKIVLSGVQNHNLNLLAQSPELISGVHRPPGEMPL